MNTTPPRPALHVGYVSTQRIPSTETDSQQVLNTVNGLAAVGVTVDLLVPRPMGPLWPGTQAFDAKVRHHYNVAEPFRLRPILSVPPNRLEAERPAHALTSSILHAGRYDLIHTRSRATVALCAALGRPVVFETYRRLAQDAPVFGRLLSQVARLPAFLGAITHSHQSADSLRALGVPADKVAVVHNGHDPRELEPRLSRAAARAALPALDSDRPTVVYTGNVQANKGLASVLDLAAACPHVDIWIVGGEDRHLALLRADIAARGLANVFTPGWVRAAELLPYLYAADVLIIPPTAGPLERFGRTVLPMKVFTYLAAGRPILAPRLPDIEEVLEDGVNAALVVPDDHGAALAALERLLTDADYGARLAAKAREHSRGLTWRARAQRVAYLYATWLDRYRQGRG